MNRLLCLMRSRYEHEEINVWRLDQNNITMQWLRQKKDNIDKGQKTLSEQRRRRTTKVHIITRDCGGVIVLKANNSLHHPSKSR